MFAPSLLWAAKKANPAAACQSVSKILNQKHNSSELLSMENAYSAHNYAPLPVVFHKSSGVSVTTPEGKRYFDFLSGYGSVSHGHIHPRLLKVAIEQMRLCTLSSRAFHNDVLGIYSKFVTEFFGYDQVLPMNTGAEGVETAIKVARRWGYERKGIAKNKALIVGCTGAFHGRTLAAISLSDDPSSYANYGPLVPGMKLVPYGDAKALSKFLDAHGKKVAGFIVEPIQGEAGVKIPPAGYLQEARRLCTKHNVMFIADEVQSGVGRSGKMLAIEHEKVRPDMIILAKALGGGFLPVSAVLSDKKFMGVMTPGTHGSTFGGNPLACRIAIEALRVMHDEKMPEKSARMGSKLLKGLEQLAAQYPQAIVRVRGRGLFAAIDFSPRLLKGNAAYAYMKLLANEGVLAKVTHGTTLRLSPPLVISDKELAECLKRMNTATKKLLEAAKK